MEKPDSNNKGTEIQHINHWLQCVIYRSIFKCMCRYDLVDLTRQALAKYANEVFLKALEGYGSNDLTKVNFHSQHFLELVEDLDTLLASHDGFLLGPWLVSAKNLATGSDQTEQVQ